MKFRAWIAIPILIICFIVIGCDTYQGVTIKGKITNLDEYSTKGSFIQLVAWNENTEIVSLIDINGNVVAIRYVSEFPKLKMSDGNKFSYKVENLEPGQYILVVQDIVPKNRPSGYVGPGPSFTRPLSKEKDRPVIIKVSEKDKPPYSINIGKAIAPFKEMKYIIRVDIDNAVYITP